MKPIRHLIALIIALLAVSLLPATLAAQEAADPQPADKQAPVDTVLDLSAADAHEAPADEVDALERQVAVVALGQGAPSGSVMQTLLGLLDDDGFEVIDEDKLRHLIDRSTVPKAPAEVTSQFVGLSTRIGRGIEKFFYKGNQSALDILMPVFNLGMAHPEVLARRPDFARQIFEAGLVMIRAYRNLERADDARRLARALVETFPGFDTRTNSVPPAVTELLDSQREAVGEAGSRIQVRALVAEGCQVLVNGTEVGEAAFVASPGAEYFVTMECGAGEAPLWRVEALQNTLLEVPVAAVHPLDYAMPNAGFRHRKQAEAYLQMVVFWAGVPRVLGVADADAEAAEATDSVILVHLDAKGDAGWSDRADKKTVSRMLLRVMTDYGGEALEAQAGADAHAVDEPVDWMSWSLVGGGALVAGASTFGLFLAEARADEVRCSPDVNLNGTPAYCAGVTQLHFADAAEFEAAKSSVHTVTAVSGVGLAAGLGLAGWGIYRLTSEQQPAPPMVRWDLGLSGQGASVAATISF